MSPSRPEVLTVEDITTKLDETPQSSKFYKLVILDAQGRMLDAPLVSPDRRGILIHVEKDVPLGLLGEGTAIDEVQEL